MFSKTMTRVIAAMVAMSMLAGCAEFDRRGGVVAEIEDNILFVAHTKSHRLFRSYLLAGVLVAAARQGGHNEADKKAISANLASVLDVALEAYNCLYPDPKSKIVLVGLASPTEDVKKIGTAEAVLFRAPAICQFFDEKMARLDYALFRLALSSLFNPQSNTYLADIRDKLMGKIPVLSSTAKAAIYTNKALNETTTIVDDLLNLTFASAGPVVTLLPLYRDSLEINMWLIIDNLTRFCSTGQAIEPQIVNGRYVASYGLDSNENACATLGYALRIMNNGNGYLPEWREFVRTMNYATRDFDAYTAHFFLVTKLIWRSCTSFLSTAELCADVLTKNGIAYSAANFIQGEGGRIYSAKVRSPTQLARQPGPSTPIDGAPPRATAAPAAVEPPSTGSINQPKPSAAPAAPPAR